MKKSITILVILAMVILLLLCITSRSKASTPDLSATEAELIIVGNYKYKILNDTEVAIYNKGIKTVNEEGVTTIDSSYFTDSDVQIPSSVEIQGKTYTVVAIGPYLGGMTNEIVTNISIPSTITTIGNRAFYKFTNLKQITLPEGITSIGNYAFERCESLKDLTIPVSVTNLGEYILGGYDLQLQYKK